MLGLVTGRPLVAAAALLALATGVTACGGGGGVGSTPGPAPAPSPASSPSPTPSPSPSPTPTPPPVAAMPFPAATAPSAYRVDEVTGSATVEATRLAGNKLQIARVTQLRDIGAPNRNVVTFGYVGTNRYYMEFNGFGGGSFGPQDRDDGGAAYEAYRKADASSGDNLEIARHGVGIALSYLTFGHYAFINATTTGGDSIVTFFASGVRTEEAQMPRSGSATFSGIADGLWVDATATRRLYGSSARLTANFATGAVTSRLDLRGHGDPFGNFAATATTPLGTFAGTGRIGSAGFAGDYAATAGYAGGFSGHFYGPTAEEYALAFKLAGPAGQGAFGVAVGKRD